MLTMLIINTTIRHEGNLIPAADFIATHLTVVETFSSEP